MDILSTKVATYFGSGATLVLTTFLASAIIFLAYLSYTPRVYGRAPPLTSDKNIFLGSYAFFSKRWTFFKEARENSASGQFSFWLGKNHVVGLTGDKARRTMLDNPNLDFASSGPLQGIGPEFMPPVHQIYVRPTQGQSYFQRRVLDVTTPEYLSKRLPLVAKDARDLFENMGKTHGNPVNPISVCYPLVHKQSSRIVFADDVADSPELLKTFMDLTQVFLNNDGGHVVCTPWFPHLSHIKRKYGRYGMNKLISSVVQKRRQVGATRGDDALQMMIDKGDSDENMIHYLINALFISVAHTSKLAGYVLNLLGNHADWQERIYNEVKNTAKQYAIAKNSSLTEQLDALPLEGWEKLSEMMDMTVKEVLRLHVAFAMTRKNIGGSPVPIAGTNYVIPPGSYVAYHSGDVHFDERLYPNPTDLDPMRFAADRTEYKQETYAYLAWGNGRHRCVGQRWAKLQFNLVIAYALARYRWLACDANGQVIDPTDRKTNFDKHGNKLPQGMFLKYVAR